MKLYELTAHEILNRIKSGTITAQDVVVSVKDRISQVDGKVKSYIRLSESPEVLADLPCPIPIALKDNLCVKGVETTCASKILKTFKAPYDAFVVEKIKNSGGVILGQVNMDEFAFGSSCETSCYGPTSNPWNLECVPGGSSGGSAAVVAADEAIWSLGSDTGGSIRQPAAFCGVVGLKPTYGRVSRFGLIAFASSLDQIGPFTKDVRDNAMLLNIIAGYDKKDSTSANVPVPDYTKALVEDVKELTIGLPKEYFIDGIEDDVKKAVLEAVEVLKSKGAQIKEISLPHTEYAVATYYIVATAEASSNLARFDGVEYGLRKTAEGPPRKTNIVDMYENTRAAGFGAEAKRRIMLGTYALSSGYYDAYYLRAQKVRTLIKEDFDKAFSEVDAIISPTSPTVSFKMGEKMNDPLAMYLSDIFTIPANLSGIPAISIPCGFSSTGLPVGLQIMTKAFDEEMLYRVAYTYEQATDWHKQKPNLD